MTQTFPPNFIFGASTAAYQIEGAWAADGKGESMWDRFAHTPGKIEGGDTGDVACDHYHRFESDLDLVRDANLSAYRFSLNWTRILPQGTGRVNEAGLAFYDRLIDATLERGIDPWLCLYHWDYSQALSDRGGWTSRDSVDWYLELAHIAATRFGDRIGHWIMFNEPSVFLSFGYLFGVHPPGLRDRDAFGAAVHHMSLATADGARLIRAECPSAKVGTVLNLVPVEALSDDPGDLAAAALADNLLNRAYLDPIFRGAYPEPIATFAAPHIHDGDLERVRVDLDFLGVNHYSRARVGAVTAEQPATGSLAALGSLGLRFAPPPPGEALTDMGWTVDPDGLFEALALVSRDYGPIPLFVTENGGAFTDVVQPDGSIDDAPRVDLLHRYMGAVHRALEHGIDVRGYFVWSLLDNLEWHHGYKVRFGIVRVDFDTLERTPKRSFAWYSDLARTKALPD